MRYMWNIWEPFERIMLASLAAAFITFCGGLYLGRVLERERCVPVTIYEGSGGGWIEGKEYVGPPGVNVLAPMNRAALLQELRTLAGDPAMRDNLRLLGYVGDDGMTKVLTAEDLRRNPMTYWCSTDAARVVDECPRESTGELLMDKDGALCTYAEVK